LDNYVNFSAHGYFIVGQPGGMPMES